MKHFYPPMSMRFYAYTQFTSLFEDIFIRHYYFHPILRKQNVRIAVGGAHMGMFSAYCHWLNPTATLVAFEADPETFLLLKENKKRNKWKKTTVVNAALANKTGLAWFYHDPHFPSSFVSSMFANRGLGGRKRIRTVRLSTYFKKHPFDYVKLDIEGAEYEVLAELVKEKQLHTPYVYVIEFHHNVDGMKNNLSDGLSLLSKNGFTNSLSAQKPQRMFGYQDVLVHAEKRSTHTERSRSAESVNRTRI